MLGDIDACPNLAVKDLAAARRFYEDVLGLKKVGSQGEQLLIYSSGATRLNLYVSAQAGSNRATAVTWDVGHAIAEVVERLKAKGVVFQRYDMPGGRWDGDIYVDGAMKVAWFEDPDGNILNLASG